MDLDLLIYKLRDNLNEIGIEQYDHRLAYRDLTDAYETIQMIGDVMDMDVTDSEVFPTYKVERCVIRVATYHAYRVYTKLAERQMGTLPQGSPHITAYDVIDAQNCLALLFGTTFNEDLLPIVLTRDDNPVVAGRVGTSILDV